MTHGSVVKVRQCSESCVIYHEHNLLAYLKAASIIISKISMNLTGSVAKIHMKYAIEGTVKSARDRLVYRFDAGWETSNPPQT
jgi:hypothetical protein